MCPSCEKEDRKKKLFDKLQYNSRKNTPDKKGYFDEFSSPSPKTHEKVKKSSFNPENTANPMNLDIKHDDLITFSDKRNEISHSHSEIIPEENKKEIKPPISENSHMKLEKKEFFIPTIEIKPPVYNEKTYQFDKINYNYNEIPQPMKLDTSKIDYFPIKYEETTNKPIGDFILPSKEESFLNRNPGNSYNTEPFSLEKSQEYSKLFRKI